MSNPSDAARLYFTPCEETFWRWSDDRQAVEWIGGSTIAFRVELQMLLESLASTGVPPWENILLMVAACRNGIAAVAEELPLRLKFDRYPMRHSLVSSVANVVERLKILHTLPEALRSSLNGRKAILALISENGPRLKDSAFNQECCEYLRQGYAISDSSTAHTKTSNDWVTELRGLQDGLLAVNETAVRLRMEVGIEALPVPAPVTSIPLVLPEPETDSEPVPLTVRELLKELEKDEEHAGLVHLTRRLLAVVTLPRPVSAPNDQPLGGVSDITNRGPFDRLLLSELAQDTDVLMTRVALNEALYMRREVPPGFPPRQRFVLLDAGIRMWGLPRLYATAAGLAMAVMQDDATAARLFRAVGSGIIPLDLTARDGLIEHLKSLELAPHPGDSLAKFIAEADGVPADFVIVTGEDVLADPEFRVCLAELGLPSLYIVAVTREGDLRMLLRSRQGERVLKEARLELEEILKGPQQSPPATRPKLRNEAIDPHLPAICRVKPFPLRLYHQIDWKNCGAINVHKPHDSLLAVTHDRRLMLWSSQQEGARQLCDALPPGKLLWHASRLDAEQRIAIVIGHLQQGQLSLITGDGNREKWDIVPIKATGPVLGISEHAGILYIVSKHEIRSCSLADGHTTATAIRPHMTWISGRFFRDPQRLYAFHHFTAEWHVLQIKGIAFLSGIKAVFDCQCRQEPVVVSYANAVVVTGKHEELKFIQTSGNTGLGPIDASASVIAKPRIAVREPHVASSVPRVSADGNRFVLSQGPQRQYNIDVDLNQLTATECWGMPDLLIHGAASNLPIRENIRHKFSVIGVHDEHLVLRTAKHTVLKLRFEPTGNRLMLEGMPDQQATFDRMKGFGFAEAPPSTGYRFKVAYWRDGSRVYLDSRGMLHLQSSDDQIPEMTLVLNDANVAGWCDRNQVWGDPAFTGSYIPRISPERVYHDWLVPFCRRLQ